MLEKLMRLGRQVAGFFPAKLPTGMTEFHEWTARFIKTYNLPTQNEDSIKFTLASIFMHLGPSDSHKPMYYFYKTLSAAASKQIAHAVFGDIKQKQLEATANKDSQNGQQSQTVSAAQS